MSLAKKMKISLTEVQIISNVLCKMTVCQAIPLVQKLQEGDEIFTSGDALLDVKLCGGIRTGMVWEIVGERYMCKICCIYLP